LQFAMIDHPAPSDHTSAPHGRINIPRKDLFEVGA